MKIHPKRTRDTPTLTTFGGVGGVSPPPDLSDLGDVDVITDPPDVGDILVWDGTNWVPQPPADPTVIPFDHGTMGATETLDLADGTWHRGTLNVACAITVQGFTVDEAAEMVVELTGNFPITWDADVDAGGGDDQPNASGATTILLWSSVGDGTIYLSKAGGGSSVSYATPAIVLGTAAAAGAASTVIRSDSTIVAFDATAPVTQAFDDVAATGSAAFAAHRDHRHGMPSAATAGQILISDTPSTPLVFADLIQTEAQDDLVYADT